MTTGIAVPHLSSDAHAAALKSAESLARLQYPEGYWWAELTADSTLEADYLLLLLWLYPPDTNGIWNPPQRERVEKAASSILRRQLADGGFNIYQHGPADISATVKAYFALKLAGIPVSDPRMQKARECILSLGGIQAANSYTKINLSLFGLYPREGVPTVPPEMMLAGNFIYEMSSWTRAIVIPLSIVQAAGGTRPVPQGLDLEELFVAGVPVRLPLEGGVNWRNFFLSVDKAFKKYENLGVEAVRRRALKKAERWMLERFEKSDGLGAIYPAMQYAIMALEALGYPVDHPVRATAQREFDNLLVERGDEFFFQPCFSPVWDTAIAGYAMTEAGYRSPGLAHAADWLVSKEVRSKGDWSVRRPRTEPSGWYFEFANEFYPDIDDTAMVLLALAGFRGHRADKQDAAVKRALRWVVDMQSRDGGWAAFDVDCQRQILNQIPFADHNAMLDPSCADITGRVLEALSAHGYRREHPAVLRGVQYLVNTQEDDGSWFGRWGVNYIYGTCFALRGLRAAGENEREAHVLRAGEWLRSVQNADGGWGESCESYDRGCYVNMKSTASQTAWALMGLMAGGDHSSSSVQKGIEWLLAAQRADGTWDEDAATGTGFPKVFYLTYHLYRNTFPIIALAEYARLNGHKQ